MNITKYDETQKADLKKINNLLEEHAKVLKKPRECIASLMVKLSNMTANLEEKAYFIEQSKRDHGILYDSFLTGLYKSEGIPENAKDTRKIVITIGIGDVPDHCDMNIHLGVKGSSTKIVLEASEMEEVFGPNFFDNGINSGYFNRYDNNWFWGYVNIGDHSHLTRIVENIYWYSINYLFFNIFSKTGGWNFGVMTPVYLGYGSREWNVYIGKYRI